MDTCIVQMDGSYDYITQYKSGENQYGDLPLKGKTVDAKYIPHANYPHGNFLLDALPPMPTQEEVILAATTGIPGFDHNSEIQKTPLAQFNDIMMLQQLRFPLPMNERLNSAFHHALYRSYSSRTHSMNEHVSLPYMANNKEEIAHGITRGDDSNGTGSGFSLLGYSGAGKTSALNVMLLHMPQVIKHHFVDGSSVSQIVYLVVNCPVASNFHVLFQRIGHSIDRALGNILPVYETILTPKRYEKIGQMIPKLARIIEQFSIGIIILDEIQNLNFNSHLENSMTNLLMISNDTGVRFGLVGTQYARDQLFNDEEAIKALRRIGDEIQADSYRTDIKYFSSIVSRLFKYQWFKDTITPDNDIIMALYRHTNGVIDQLINIYMFMQIDYLVKKRKPSIDASFVEKVARKHFSTIQNIQLARNREDEQARLKNLEEINLELESIRKNIEDSSNNQAKTPLCEDSNYCETIDNLKNELIPIIKQFWKSIYREDTIISTVDSIIAKQLKNKGLLDKDTICALVTEKLLKDNKTDKRSNTSRQPVKKGPKDVSYFLSQSTLVPSNTYPERNHPGRLLGSCPT